MKRLIRLTVSVLLIVSIAKTSRSQAPTTASIQGVVVKLGTNEPVAGAGVELTRLEGTPSAPLNPGAAQAFAALFDNPVAVGAAPPPALAPEVQYAQTGENGEFSFRNLKPGGYRLVAT